MDSKAVRNTVSDTAGVPHAGPVPMLDLKPQFAEMRDEVLAAVTRVFDTQHFILGPEGAALEREIAAYVGAEHAVGCASGSDALLLAFMALDIKAGDEVVTSPFTFFATAGSIARLGAKPVFVDIEPETFNIDPARIESVVTWRTKALCPVHLYGQTADMDAIREVADLHGVPIVEDSAQAIGAEFNGRRTGVLGHMACFSFYPTKNLGGAGDGGMITTDDIELAEKLKMLRDHGMRPKYYYRMVGMNSRLDELQAAVLRLKLARLESWHARRAEIACTYLQLFEDAGLLGHVGLPKLAAGRRHVYNQFIVRIADGRRDALREHLRERQVGTEIYYPVPLHLQDCFRSLGHKEGDFPESERAARESLALPIYPDLTPAMQEAVVARVAEFFA
ncbi:MAG TPA: DegT/DnrJ/EryC1/StrS family aminotransferase [Blastocatellia bacterium]|nr:DegT/DnrJ/EryC1/StrS family aminotransferase [Blastocatellia bacterium]